MAGLLRVDLVRGKSLIKSDLIGKSDPYALIELGKQTGKTHVINNTQVLSIFQGETKEKQTISAQFFKGMFKDKNCIFSRGEQK
jgi:hypothetical protein